MREQPTGGGVSVFLYVCVAFSGFTSVAVTDVTRGNIDPGLEMRSAGTVKVKRSEEQRRGDLKASAATHWRRKWPKIDNVCVNTKEVITNGDRKSTNHKVQESEYTFFPLNTKRGFSNN